jgi:quinoprotein glucose dehydrogenase
LVLCACQQAPLQVDWPHYAGDAMASRHSALTQIDTSNAHTLELAWVYHCGDADTVNNRSQIQCQPIVIHGILYATSPGKKVFALDAATGKQLWVFDPLKMISEGEYAWAGTNRGLAHWSDGKSAFLFYSIGSWLFCLDRATGVPVSSFGKNGKIDLKQGLTAHKQDFFIVANTPGIVYRDLIIMGSRVSEGADAAPGHIRAYDVRTGKQRWIFHTIPQPGEKGYESWEAPNAWKNTGGANSWAGFALDEQRGMVYAPTGSATFDFYGGLRKGNNLYANCLLALDAGTGKLLWHYQLVHHDVWDRDLPATPNLVTLSIHGKRVDAVAQVTKTGHVFVFDRVTGQPVFPIQEVAVPGSDLPGERLSATQPLPTRPPALMRQAMTEQDLSRIHGESYPALLKTFRGYKSGHGFAAPSTKGTVLFPGFDGGANWGGAACDPRQGIMYVNITEMPWVLTMVPVATTKGQSKFSAGQSVYQLHCMSCHGPERKGNGSSIPPIDRLENRYDAPGLLKVINGGKGMMPGLKHLAESDKQAVIDFLLSKEVKKEVVEQEAESLSMPYTTTGYNKFLDAKGYPAITPPWGTLQAVNLNTGSIQWKVPFGEDQALTKQGIPVTGLESYGGPVVTDGGVILIGASKDAHFRVYHQRTGAELWKYPLPAAAYATPATYAVNGRQYVVIAAGGGKLGTVSGDAYFAFALKRKQ